MQPFFRNVAQREQISCATAQQIYNHQDGDWYAEQPQQNVSDFAGLKLAAWFRCDFRPGVCDTAHVHLLETALMDSRECLT